MHGGILKSGISVWQQVWLGSWRGKKPNIFCFPAPPFFMWLLCVRLKSLLFCLIRLLYGNKAELTLLRLLKRLVTTVSYWWWLVKGKYNLKVEPWQGNNSGKEMYLCVAPTHTLQRHFWFGSTYFYLCENWNKKEGTGNLHWHPLSMSWTLVCLRAPCFSWQMQRFWTVFLDYLHILVIYLSSNFLRLA